MLNKTKNCKKHRNCDVNRRKIYKNSMEISEMNNTNITKF